MKTIWKYQLAVTDEQLIEMPVTPKLLSVAVQNNVPCLWAVVDPKKFLKKYKIYIFGTGEPFPDNDPGFFNLKFIGTFMLLDGSFVGHVFWDTCYDERS